MSFAILLQKYNVLFYHANYLFYFLKLITFINNIQSKNYNFLFYTQKFRQ